MRHVTGDVFVFEERRKASLFYEYTKQKELSWNYCEESVVALDAVALVRSKCCC